MYKIAFVSPQTASAHRVPRDTSKTLCVVRTADYQPPKRIDGAQITADAVERIYRAYADIVDENTY